MQKQKKKKEEKRIKRIKRKKERKKNKQTETKLPKKVAQPSTQPDSPLFFQQKLRKTQHLQNIPLSSTAELTKRRKNEKIRKKERNFSTKVPGDFAQSHFHQFLRQKPNKTQDLRQLSLAFTPQPKKGDKK
jgi:hypothetical protein